MGSVKIIMLPMMHKSCRAKIWEKEFHQNESNHQQVLFHLRLGRCPGLGDLLKMQFRHPLWEPVTKGEWIAYRLHLHTLSFMRDYRVRKWW